MLKKLTLLLIFIISCSNSTTAQFSGFSHEIGVIAGPVALQSDYGLRNNLSTNSGNTGFGIGLVYYMNFSYTADCNCYTPQTYFNDHFKVRAELSYNKTELQHFGKWVDKSGNSAGVQQLRAMRGSTAITNLGVQLEYYPLSIREFAASVGSFAPFISLGGQFSHYDPSATSSLGPLGSPTTTFPKYLDPSDGKPYGFTNDGDDVFSVVTSIGTRYKLSPLSDLMVDLRFQYYFSDWVDGLNPNKDLHKENKANDWLVWFNVGYILYLQ